MNMNWKAGAIGGVTFWILSLILGYAGGLAGWGNAIAAIIGGFVGAWQAKDKTPKMGGMTGALAGVIGGVIAYVVSLVYASGYATWAFSFGIAAADWIVMGLILAAIGGALSSMMKK